MKTVYYSMFANKGEKMKKISVIFAIMALAAVGIMSGCESGTTDPINTTVTFTWTATGDDGTLGTAISYDLRYSTDENMLMDDWASTTPISGLPTPQPSGTPESLTVTIAVETGVNYYFAIKAADEENNVSPLSNIVTVVFADVTAPAAIIDLSAD